MEDSFEYGGHHLRDDFIGDIAKLKEGCPEMEWNQRFVELPFPKTLLRFSKIRGEEAQRSFQIGVEELASSQVLCY